MHLPNDTLLQGGKYKIIRFINSGGFGCTYEAEHVMLEMRIAIKEFFIKDFCNRDEKTAHVTVGTQSKKGLVDKLRRKFIDEAKALFRLQHPNIVRVTDVFEENGTAYFVMDYIEGHSLSEIVNQEGPLSEERALKYIRQTADALQYVHEHNRLHLDVKPGNIMINSQDNAILVDFGASKQYDEEDGENTSTLLGKTPGYAPLEQIGNDVVKFMPATDIYALGATLYKLLSGVTPISANLLASGEELEPLPTHVSEATRKAVNAAMQINKKKRPQTISEFISIFNDIQTNEEVTVIGVPNRTKPIAEKEEKKQINGHDYIDLGLSVKWATCNLGASRSTEPGNYYPYGGDWAHEEWGATWRMPTEKDFLELKKECKWEWTVQDELEGYKVTGSNGNSIFLPAGGYRNELTMYCSKNFIINQKIGYYWSISTLANDSERAYYLHLHSSYYGVNWNFKTIRQNIRAVTD